jgi:hypothetical protein
MCDAPCSECPGSCFWFLGQFLPMTCGCTQYALRRKVINYDMKQYRCFQGQFTVCCCISAGNCGEESCPELCLCCEAHLCNGPAVSASRGTVMDRYDLMSDPCDNRLIAFSNCMDLLSCCCDILAIIDGSFHECARIVDLIQDLVFHTVSGCMTAQVAHEINLRIKNGGAFPQAMATPVDPYAPPTYDNKGQAYYAGNQGGYPQQQQQFAPASGYPPQGGYPPQQYPQQQPQFAPYKVVLCQYSLFCITPNVIFVYSYTKTSTHGVTVYIKIRSTILQCNVTCTKTLLLTVLCVSNQHFYSEGNVHST